MVAQGSWSIVRKVIELGRNEISEALRRIGRVMELDRRECIDLMFGEEVPNLSDCYVVFEDPEKTVEVAVYKDGTAELCWDREFTPDEFAEEVESKLRELGYRIKEIPMYRGRPERR